MKIIAFIEDEEVIEKILKQCGLWDLKVKPPPKVKVSSVTISSDDSDSQAPLSAPLLSGSDIPDGLQQDFVATLGDSDGYGFCYIPSLSRSRENLAV